MAERLTNSIIVKGNADELYRAWSQYETFPQFMRYVKSIDKMDDKTSNWVVEGPAGKDIEWTAEITRDELNRRIAWKTLKGDVDVNGQVTFLDLPEDQTEITVIMMYQPPAGKLGEIAAKLFVNPEKRLEQGMRDFKNLVEGNVRRLPDKD